VEGLKGGRVQRQIRDANIAHCHGSIVIIDRSH
jgi:hypothetical protein